MPRPRQLPEAQLSDLSPILPQTFSSSQIPRMGMEFEIFAYSSQTFAPIGTSGSEWTPGQVIESIVAKGPAGTLLVRDPSTGVITGAKLPSGAAFSLEPGGQVEFASAPLETMKDLIDNVAMGLGLLEKATRGEITFLSHGTNPISTPDHPLLVPKTRYLVMQRFLNSVPNGRGVHMMRHTCTIQPNLDMLPSLETWRQGVETFVQLSPHVAEVFSNSVWFCGQRSIFPSERQQIWLETDPTRTGLNYLKPSYQGVVEPEEAYANWALDAQVLFIPELSLAEQPLWGELNFRQWRELGSYKGIVPTDSHWQLHMSTLFPDLRLRSFLEIRDIDGQDFPFLSAPLAFWSIVLQSHEGLKLAKAWMVSLASPDRTHISPPLAKVWMQDALALAVRLGWKEHATTLEHFLNRTNPGAAFTGTALEFVQKHSTKTPRKAFLSPFQ